jgi:hypothetical protein
MYTYALYLFRGIQMLSIFPSGILKSFDTFSSIIGLSQNPLIFSGTCLVGVGLGYATYCSVWRVFELGMNYYNSLDTLSQTTQVVYNTTVQNHQSIVSVQNSLNAAHQSTVATQSSVSALGKTLETTSEVLLSTVKITQAQISDTTGNILKDLKDIKAHNRLQEDLNSIPSRSQLEEQLTGLDLSGL